MADLQGLLQIVEDEKQRLIEDVANAYYLEHVVVNYENPLSMPQTNKKDRPRFGLRFINEQKREVDLSN